MNRIGLALVGILLIAGFAAAIVDSAPVVVTEAKITRPSVKLQLDIPVYTPTPTDQNPAPTGVPTPTNQPINTPTPSTGPGINQDIFKLEGNLLSEFGDFRCNNYKYMTMEECRDLKEYISEYAAQNFPSKCVGKFTPKDLAVTYYWQLYYESVGFNRNAVSPDNARGLAQFIPGTAAQYHLYDFLNDRENVRAQTEYMRDILNMNHIGCSIPLALAGYNAGPWNKAVKQGRIPNNGETDKYVARITGKADDYITLT